MYSLFSQNKILIYSCKLRKLYEFQMLLRILSSQEQVHWRNINWLPLHSRCLPEKNLFSSPTFIPFWILLNSLWQPVVLVCQAAKGNEQVDFVKYFAHRRLNSVLNHNEWLHYKYQVRRRGWAWQISGKISQSDERSKFHQENMG